MENTSPQLPPQVQNLVDKLDLLGFYYSLDLNEYWPDAGVWSDGGLVGVVRWDTNEAWLVPTTDPGNRLFVTGVSLRSVPELLNALEQAVVQCLAQLKSG